MPELPEVETVRTYLAPYVVGNRIVQVEVNAPNVLKNTTVPGFRNRVVGKRIEGLVRRGKYLQFLLSGEQAVLVHLRMTGKLLYRPALQEEPRARLRLHLQKGLLVYEDVRTFGGFWLVPKTGPTGVPGYDTLGPDAAGEAFTAAYLRQCLAGKKRMIKTLLLDQHVVAGLGNIYVDEALFAAHIRPDRQAATISRTEVGKLHAAIGRVLAQGLAHGGTTIRDFVDSNGREGTNQSFLQVYGREGMPCPHCGTRLVYTKVSGRGTRYCPHCQRKRRRTQHV